MDERDHVGCSSDVMTSSQRADGSAEERHVPPGGAVRRRGHDLTWQYTIAAGLKTLSWHHVDVEFPGLFPLAHNKICALGRSPFLKWLFKEGEPIVSHQADYLLATAGRMEEEE